ncbi:hypothetical protein, partial [Corallococcus caeni]|uniref:hypothetical protein n=1 Tax=Corallococcus caeni TaxID=3082388 RepID=UPI0030C75CF6
STNYNRGYKDGKIDSPGYHIEEFEPGEQPLLVPDSPSIADPISSSFFDSVACLCRFFTDLN